MKSQLASFCEFNRFVIDRRHGQTKQFNDCELYYCLKQPQAEYINYANISDSWMEWLAQSIATYHLLAYCNTHDHHINLYHLNLCTINTDASK